VKCSLVTPFKGAQVRGCSAERFGSGRSALSFIPLYSPLQNRSTFRRQPPKLEAQWGKPQTAIPGWYFAMTGVNWFCFLDM
jgi:hypothetical protein